MTCGQSQGELRLSLDFIRRQGGKKDNRKRQPGKRPLRKFYKNEYFMQVTQRERGRKKEKERKREGQLGVLPFRISL